ncbi:circularly permuted type 2 ATP-grasp protein [Deinococcus budaensis]|uniref:Putative circularly permuted ATP-grasp superfamily protein n=1 Tax=Deinococcus budaensis TaxID=1665626 RepID=A0A7W8GH61_9DEIO|nr:circularly permuted type 2 ATP-grasp protein [Deinococcus budaensis]MBB5235408.1 putative circularly permuted ATP-grasp superfamily protein [Deinococcus budaensis]
MKYEPGQRFFDEMYTPGGAVRPHYQGVQSYISARGVPEFSRRHAMLDLAFRHQGITFTVYGDAQGTERTFPFDPVPRVIPASEWRGVEAGLTQRVRALNAFLADIYGPAEILRDGVIPAELVYTSAHFRREVHGLKVPGGIYTHIVGTDLIRDESGQYLVLEDNLRSPSGVSYLLANRQAMTRIYPGMFEGQGVRPVGHYATALLHLLQSVSPREGGTVVVLTPGMYNSAYFEHAYLAQQMGVELVEGRDLFVDGGRVWMRTTGGRQRVDVIYRRVDDDFLDPLTFRPDSALGVPGLVEVYRQGHVAIANAIGTGVADDKAVYAYVPEMIRYYLNESPLLNNVPTFLGWNPDHLPHILDNAAELVIKAVGEAGGYGMLIGPAATRAEVEAFVEKVRASPRDYIAQPVVGLSRHPTFYPDSGEFEPAHVDLRPYILYGGEEVTIVPGGLTRVALRRGSLVVNSSQGGGSKDTWVLDHDGPASPQGMSQLWHGDPLERTQRQSQYQGGQSQGSSGQSQSQEQTGGGSQRQSQGQAGTPNPEDAPGQHSYQQQLEKGQLEGSPDPDGTAEGEGR